MRFSMELTFLHSVQVRHVVAAELSNYCIAQILATLALTCPSLANIVVPAFRTIALAHYGRRSRQDPEVTVEIGHQTNTFCCLSDIATRRGRKLRWDPVKEQFLDDDEANKMIARHDAATVAGLRCHCNTQKKVSSGNHLGKGP